MGRRPKAKFQRVHRFPIFSRHIFMPVNKFQPLGERGTEAIVLGSLGGVEGTRLVVYGGVSFKVHVGDEDPCRPH